MLGEAGFMEIAEIPSAVFKAFLGGDVLAAYKAQQKEASERVRSLAGFEQAIGSLAVEHVIQALVNMEHCQAGAGQQGSRLGNLNLNLDLSRLSKNRRPAPLVNMGILQAAAGQRGSRPDNLNLKLDLGKLGKYGRLPPLVNMSISQDNSRQQMKGLKQGDMKIRQFNTAFSELAVRCPDRG
eukprot:gene21073-27954_t